MHCVMKKKRPRPGPFRYFRHAIVAVPLEM